MAPALVAGHLTATRVWQRGGVRPVLALHCSLAHAGAWAGLAEAVRGVTVTAFDQPGHGRSGDWDGSGDYHALATRIAVALAGGLGSGQPVDLFGHSFGGTVALRMAVERPDLVRSLTLFEPVLFAAARDRAEFVPFQASHLELVQLLADGDRTGAAALFQGQWGTGAFADLPDRQRSYITDRIHLIAAQNPVLLDDAAGLLQPGRLEAVRVPVLLIEGGQSPAIIGAVQSVLARRMPRVTRRVVPEAAHMVPITHPLAVAAAVQTHLDAS